MVKNGRIVAVDGTKADMSKWSEGTTFVAVTSSTMQWLIDMEFILNNWSA